MSSIVDEAFGWMMLCVCWGRVRLWEGGWFLEMEMEGWFWSIL
jgi:hypothetical protein